MEDFINISGLIKKQTLPSLKAYSLKLNKSFKFVKNYLIKKNKNFKNVSTFNIFKLLNPIQFKFLFTCKQQVYIF